MEALRRSTVIQIETIRQYIIDNFLFGDALGLNDEMSFIDKGIIDSTGMLELIMHLEESFNIKLEDDELVPENLDSVQNIGRFLDQKLAQQAQGTGSSA